MTRSPSSGLAIALGLAAWWAPCAVASQTVVPVHEEPRHRLVHDAPGLRVLDILIEPGDTTLFHRHDAPIAYVQIDASVVNQQIVGGGWGVVRRPAAPPTRSPGQVSWNESYEEEPVSHRVTAVGPGRFRLIGVVNRGEGGATPRTGPLGPFSEPEGGSRYFSRARRALSPGTRMAWVAHDRPVVMVLGSGGPVSVLQEGGGGATRALNGPGDFLVLAPGRSHSIVNSTNRAAVVAFVEVR